MLTNDQKKQIAEYISSFQIEAKTYLKIKDQIQKCVEIIKEKTGELSKVAKEERQIENAMAILYGQTKKQSKVSEIEMEIKDCQARSSVYIEDLNRVKTGLIEAMRNLPIPADLEDFQNDSETFFPYFEEAKLGEEAVSVILDLFRQSPPLIFGDVLILADRVVIKNVSERQEAIQKLVDAIQNFRLHTDNLSKSYERIDVLVERLNSSKLYASILKVLSSKGKLSAQQIASALSVEERKIYDSCYNLTRDNWSPNPVQKTASGEWELTFAGEILINRLYEKHPEEKTSISTENSR